MTDRDYAIKSMKEITFQMASHAQDYLEDVYKRQTEETLHRPVLWMRSKKTERSKSVYSVTRIHLDM